MNPSYGVWLRSCPRRAVRKAVRVLSPHIGLVQAERELSDPGGRCVAIFSDAGEAERLAGALRDLGCSATSGEVAPWP